MSNPVMYGVGGILLDATIENIIDKYTVSIIDIAEEIQDHLARQGFSEVYTADVSDYIYDALGAAGFAG